MNHKVKIMVAKDDANQVVLTSMTKRIRARLAKFLFGGFSQVLVLEPGKSIDAVEIHEI